MGNTSIGWTDKSWSPLRVRVKADAAEIARAKNYTSLVQIAEKMAGHVGPHCEHVSEGCRHCYSDTNNGRCLPANGTGLPFDRRSRDMVDPFVDEKILAQPLKWRKDQRIFVENQSDLFGEWVTDEQIATVFALMSFCHWHTFQVLTKRERRMCELLSSSEFLEIVKERVGFLAADRDEITWLPGEIKIATKREDGTEYADCQVPWPLPNVWLGVSVEDQKTADERIPLLLYAPAALHFVSYEPALGPVDFTRIPYHDALVPNSRRNCLNGHLFSADGCMVGFGGPVLGWLIVGGESGRGARPFDADWARQTIEQCRDAGVACFVKQLGAKPFDSASGEVKHLFEPCGHECDCCDECPSNEGQRPRHEHPEILRLADRKGEDMDAWPKSLRVREFPKGR